MALFAILIIGIIALVFRKKTGGNAGTVFDGTQNNVNKMCSHYSPFILLAANKFSVNPKIIDAMIFVESSDGANTNHSSGEIGVMAVSYVAAIDVHRAYKETEKFNLEDPHDNIFIATGYLRLCFNHWKNWDRAIVAYNVGIGKEIANWESHPYLIKVKERMRFQC